MNNIQTSKSGKPKNVHKIQITRHIIQLIAFLLSPAIFYTLFSSMRSLVTSIVSGSFSPAINIVDIMLIAAIFALTILFGRFFCGFVCSFGAMGDLLYAIGRRFHKGRIKVPARLDSVLKYVKFFILAFNIIVVWILAAPISSGTSPWEVWGMLSRPSSISSLTAIFSIGGLLLILIIAACIFIERAFCRYLCPLGACLAIFGRFSFFKLKKRPSRCGSCKLCSHPCPMGVDLDGKRTISSGECILCGKCIENCPKQNFFFPRKYMLTMATALALFIAVLLSSNALTTSMASQHNAGTASSNSSVTSDSSGQANDGSVTSDNSATSDGAEPENSSDSLIIENPETDEASDEESAESYAQDKDSTEASAEGDSQNDASSENSTESYAQDDASSASTSLSSLDLSNISDGTYTGSGTGFRGDITVSVTVANHQITSIEVQSASDDSSFLMRAENGVISEIVSDQSLDVDTVSGATFSSNGIIAAVADALGIEYENPNNSASAGHHGRH